MSIRIGIVLFVVACGPASTGPAPTPSAPTGPSPAELQAQRDRDERARRDQLGLAHRKLESEQSDALAAACDPKAPATASKNDRCLPSCYQTEPPDARAGKQLAGASEIQHTVCQRVLDNQQYGPAVQIDELDSKLHARAFPRSFPAAHKRGSWQATIETALRDDQRLPRGDVVVVTGAWRNLAHPITRESLRCVTVSHYTRSLRGKLGDCGTTAGVTCEAAGNGAARAINVVRYRLAEARQLRGAGKTTECQQAALEAIAVAYGLPRWRQYKKLNVQQWRDNLRYKTRFDGVLDEETLFSTVATLGSEAASVYTECGGPGRAKTTPQQEQSFHTCW